jgi:ATP-binding cassette subfamily B protein
MTGDSGLPTAEPSADLSGAGDFLRRAGRALLASPGQSTLILIALCIETSFTIAVPVSFKYLADFAIANSDQGALMRVLAVLAFGVVAAACAGLARDYLWARFSIGFLNKVRSEMFDRLIRLSIDFFGRMEVAEIVARFSTDLASLESALAAAPAWALVPVLEATVAFVMLFVLDWRLALVASTVVPVSLLGPRLVVGRGAAASYQRKLDEAALMGVLQEKIVAHSVVRAFSLENVMLGRFRERLETLGASCLRTAVYGSILERSSGIGTLVLQVVVLGCGATMAYRHQLTIGSLAAFQTLFLTLSWNVGYVSQFFPYLLQAAAGTKRIEELLDETSRVTEHAGAAALPEFRAGIRFESVVFAYTPGRPNLDNLSLEIPAGFSVAFVGPSGCGKSTVLSLLMRFYDPDQGQVLYDGLDVNAVSLASLRQQIGVVFQDSILFNTSIRENIRLGKLGATDVEVEGAARAAELHDLVQRLPDGYDTQVGERGSRLSGGQRQRVAIARAILRDPKILVLDEATSALDSETEAAINQTLHRLGQGRTVVSVSHRLAAVAACDRIFTLEAGCLVESGSHQELLGTGGLYSRLWAKQSGVSVTGAEQRASIVPSSLGAIPMFSGLDEDEHLLLAARLSTERIPAGRDVFRQGDRGDRLYVIARGTVAVFGVSVSGEARTGAAEQLLGVLQDGDYFGEIALIRSSPRTATVRTRTECVFLTLDRDSFLDLLARQPELRQKVEAVVRDRLAAQFKN